MQSSGPSQIALVVLLRGGYLLGSGRPDSRDLELVGSRLIGENQVDVPWPFLHNLEDVFMLAAYVQLLVGYAYCIMQFSPTHRSISSSARERLMMDDEKDSILVRHNALRIYSRANPDFRVMCR